MSLTAPPPYWIDPSPSSPRCALHAHPPLLAFPSNSPPWPTTSGLLTPRLRALRPIINFLSIPRPLPARPLASFEFFLRPHSTNCLSIVNLDTADTHLFKHKCPLIHTFDDLTVAFSRQDHTVAERFEVWLVADAGFADAAVAREWAGETHRSRMSTGTLVRAFDLSIGIQGVRDCWLYDGRRRTRLRKFRGSEGSRQVATNLAGGGPCFLKFLPWMDVMYLLEYQTIDAITSATRSRQLYIYVWYAAFAHYSPFAACNATLDLRLGAQVTDPYRVTVILCLQCRPLSLSLLITTVAGVETIRAISLSHIFGTYW